MKNSTKIIFGKEQVLKAYNGEPLTLEEEKLNVKTYTFNSNEELEAFKKGITEAVGWIEVCFPTEELEIVN